MLKTQKKFFGLKRLVLLILLCSLSRISLSDAGFNPPLTALRCGTLLDVERKKVLHNATIVVSGERIVEILKQSKQDSIPKYSKVIDLHDHACMPGLMDMHYHPMAHNGIEPNTMYNKSRSSAEYALTGASNVAKMLKLGFTTLRVPGHPPDPGYALVDLREAINKGLLEGPRLFVAPHTLSPKRSQAETLAQVNKMASGLGKEVRESLLKSFQVHQAIQHNKVGGGPDGVRAAVQRQIANGADWIKIHLDSGGMLGSPITPNTFTDEEVKVFAEETHRHGKRLVVGAHGDKASLTATLAGADSIDHGLYISEKTAEIMRAKGTYLVPTLTIFNDNLFTLEHDNPETLDNWSKLVLSGLRQVKDRQVLREDDRLRDKSFQYAYKVGVKIANGSDQSSAESALREFTYLVDQGVSTWDAIIMGTLNGADLLGMKDQLGSITVGKYADIVAMPDSPLDRIEAIQKINFVMKNGELIRHDNRRY